MVLLDAMIMVLTLGHAATTVSGASCPAGDYAFHMPRRWRGDHTIEENNEGPEWLMAKQVLFSTGSCLAKQCVDDVAMCLSSCEL